MLAGAFQKQTNEQTTDDACPECGEALVEGFGGAMCPDCGQ